MLRTNVMLVVVLLAGAGCKKSSESTDRPAATRSIPTADAPATVPRERLAAINGAIQATAASLSSIGDADCAKATAAVKTIVSNTATIREQDAELRKALAAANDPDATEWLKRQYDPIIKAHAMAAGKQLGMKGPSSKCMADDAFKAALGGFGAAAMGGGSATD